MDEFPESDHQDRPEPGTRLDLIEDARQVGLELTDRQFTEWRRLGLVGAPKRQRTGPTGQDLAIFSSEQRALFRAIARDRVQGVSNAWLASHPVNAWLNFGDDSVSIEQLRAALTTAVGKPTHSTRVAAITARSIVDQIDLNDASVSARAFFKSQITEQLSAGPVNEAKVRAAVLRVFQPGNVVIYRGSSDAPLHVDAVTTWLVATMTATRKLKTITDDQLREARLQHLASLPEYIRNQAARQAEGGPQLADLYADVTPISLAKQAVSTLLLLLGMNILRDRRAAGGR